jgi:hypothetical protein
VMGRTLSLPIHINSEFMAHLFTDAFDLALCEARAPTLVHKDI